MIKVIVVSTDIGDEETLLGEAQLLGNQEARNEVVEMDDLISSLIQSVSGSVVENSKLKLEIAGTIKITAGAEPNQKLVCFNVHNESVNEGYGSMKLTIETDVKAQPALSQPSG
jgi:hypothetical protein